MDREARSGTLEDVLESLLRIGFGLGGLLSLATGVWMLAAPSHWYEVFPGAVPDFGSLNTHFVRDMGGWYIAGGILLLFALTNPRRFGGVALVVVTVASGSHAATHVADIVSGRVGADHWIIDAPLVFAPVVILGVLLWIWWRLQSESHAPASEAESAEAGSPALFNE